MSPFPSDDQSFVINHTGRLVVVAGPGTGKTRTVVERMIRLLSENPERVISFITFTRTCRRDTDRKLRRTVGRKAVEIATDEFPRITTLHTFAKTLVHRYSASYDRAPNFNVLVPSQGEKKILISEVIEDLGLAIDPSELEAAITQMRSTEEWPTQLGLERISGSTAMEAFESLLRFYNTFDMEGLVAAACQILRKATNDLPQILLQVDEYQDLNPKDQELVRLVSAAESSQVVVVGDDAQSIYGFRHARPVGIRELWESPEWEHRALRQCHRLPSHILLAAQSLIRPRNYLGGQVELPRDDGRRVVTLQCTRPQLQVEAVARHIRHQLDAGSKDEGGKLAHADFMVLCPTNAQANQVADLLDGTHGIPTKQRHGGAIPQHLWRLLLVLRMLNNSDGLALRQWLEIIGLPATRIREIRTHAIQSGKSLHEHCSSLSDERISVVFRSLERLSETMIDPVQFREALYDFPSLAVEEETTVIINEIVTEVPIVGRMIGRVYETYGVIDEGGEEQDIPDEDRALVTTMHSAKGLEAEFVYIMWLDDRFMPAPGRNPEEEERVLYVALTRARQDVILTFHERYEKVRRRYLRDDAMSPFLHSIRDHLDIRRVTADDLKAPHAH